MGLQPICFIARRKRTKRNGNGKWCQSDLVVKLQTITVSDEYISVYLINLSTTGSTVYVP